VEGQKIAIIDRKVKITLIFTSLIFTSFGLAVSWLYKVPFPFKDMLEIMAFLDGDPSFLHGENFTRLQSMEHRPAIPAYFWLLDRIAFNSTGNFSLFISQLSLAIASLMTVYKWSGFSKGSKLSSFVVFASSLGLTFSLLNFDNINRDMQLHMTLSFLFLVISIYFAVNVDAKLLTALPTSSSLFLSLSSGVLAAFSFGYGLVTLPLILAYSLTMKWAKTIVTIILIANVCLLLVYFSLPSQGFSNVGKLNIQVTDLITSLGYALTLIAGVFAGTDIYLLTPFEKTTFNKLAGLVLLASFLWGAISFIKHQQSLDTEERIRKGIALLITSACLGGVLIITLSRPMETSGLVTRYFLLSTLFTLAIPGLLLSNQAVVNGRYHFYLAVTFLAISLAGHITNTAYPMRKWHNVTVSSIAAEMKIYDLVDHENFGPSLHDWPETIADVWPRYAQRIGLSEKTQPYSWFNQPLHTLPNTDAIRKCDAQVLSIKSIPNTTDSWHFSGRVKRLNPVALTQSWVIATNQDGTIVGLGSFGKSGEINSEEKPLRSYLDSKLNIDVTGFRGFIRSEQIKSLSFYMITNENICAIKNSKSKHTL